MLTRLDGIVDPVPKASLWQTLRPSISTPPSHATTRLFARSLVTRPKYDTPSLQTTTQSKRSHAQSTVTQAHPATPNPSKHPPASTTSTQSPHNLLVNQRLSRPLSPHLTIYRPQITSVLSVLQRLTGLSLSAAFTLFPILYLASTTLGLPDLDSISAESLAASFGSLPWLVKSAVKFGVGWVFCFHGLNSLRFLAWSFAWGLENRMVARSGWGVVLGSVLGAVGLVWLI